MKYKDLERVVEYPVRNTNFAKNETSLCNFEKVNFMKQRRLINFFCADKNVQPWKCILRSLRIYTEILYHTTKKLLMFRCSHPEVLLVKGVLKICSKFNGENPCRSVISINLRSNFIEITLQDVCSPLNLLHIFRTPFTKNTSERLLLKCYTHKQVHQQVME